MKSISLDSSETGMEENSGSSCLWQRNLSASKVPIIANDNAGDHYNFGIGVGNRRYGGWVNVVRSRIAAQQAVNKYGCIRTEFLVN